MLVVAEQIIEDKYGMVLYEKTTDLLIDSEMMMFDDCHTWVVAVSCGSPLWSVFRSFDQLPTYCSKSRNHLFPACRGLWDSPTIHTIIKKREREIRLFYYFRVFQTIAVFPFSSLFDLCSPIQYVSFVLSSSFGDSFFGSNAAMGNPSWQRQQLRRLWLASRGFVVRVCFVWQKQQ